LSLVFYMFAAAVALLLGLLGWSLAKPARKVAPQLDAALLEECHRQHISYFPQIQQALQPADFEFLASRGARALVRRIRRERYRVARLYLAALHGDFERLLRIAQVIAALSPKVVAMQEFERLRLILEFACRYHMIRLSLLLGVAPTPQIANICQMVSTLAVRMEAAMTELAERAAMAAKLASSLERRGMHLT
jgi:hypothetical protein